MNQSAKVIHDILVKVYGAYSYLAFARWTVSFKAETCSERPETLKRSKQMFNLSSALFVKIGYSYPEEQTSLSRDTLNRIIKDKLELTRHSSRCVPHE